MYISPFKLIRLIITFLYFANVISKNGEPFSENDLNQLTDGSVGQLPNEEGKVDNIVAIGQTTLNGIVKTDYFFSEMVSNDMQTFKENAIKIATSYHDKDVKTLADAIMPAATQPSYIDTYSWAIHDDINPSVIGGYFNSTVEYYKQGQAVSGGKTVSVWDMNSFNQTEPINGYQTRDASSRHSIQAYMPDEKLLSYGPSGDVGSSSVSVTLSGGVPSV